MWWRMLCHAPWLQNVVKYMKRKEPIWTTICTLGGLQLWPLLTSWNVWIKLFFPTAVLKLKRLEVNWTFPTVACLWLFTISWVIISYACHVIDNHKTSTFCGCVVLSSASLHKQTTLFQTESSKEMCTECTITFQSKMSIKWMETDEFTTVKKNPKQHQ